MRTSGIAFKIVILILAATLAAGCSREAKKTRLLQQADTYFRNGSYDKAKLSYVNALTLDPTNALIFERLGLMWLEDGAPRRAAPFLAKLRNWIPGTTKIDSDSAVVTLQRAISRRLHAKHPKSLNRIRPMVLRLSP